MGWDVVPGGTSAKEPYAGDMNNVCSIPASGKSPGEDNGYSLQYSFLEDPMDRGAWWTTVQSVAKSQTLLKRISTPISGRQMEAFKILTFMEAPTLESKHLQKKTDVPCSHLLSHESLGEKNEKNMEFQQSEELLIERICSPDL